MNYTIVKYSETSVVARQSKVQIINMYVNI